ncbi:MAG: hypothetical protein WEA54_00690 [Actinomycetota bacterium]
MLATGWYMIVFRTLHILAGVAWVGSLFLFLVFVQPSVAAIAPAGAPFVAELVGRRRLVDRLIGMGVITVVAGLFLYWHYLDLLGFGDWVSSGFGGTITLGMVAAIVALSIGIFGTRPTVMRMLALGRQAAESGGPPSPEIQTEMAAIQGRLKVFGKTSLVLLVIAVLTMAIGRYV